MSHAGRSVVSGRCAGGFVRRPSVRPYLTSGVAVASAGILAAGLVTAPPEVSVARTEVRGVQLIAFALPSTAPSAAVLEQFVRNQGQTVLPLITEVGTADSLGAVRSTGSPTQVIDATAQSLGDPLRESQQVTSAALVDSSGFTIEGLLGGLLLAGFFIVAVPVFWTVVIVTSAINVVLDALGLPLLPNVPDPPFGPTPVVTAAAAPTVTTDPVSSDPVVSQTNKTALLSGGVDTDPLSSGAVERETHKTASSAGTVRTNRPLRDPVAPDTDTANTSKPLTNVTKDSPMFTPKLRGRESSSTDSELARTPVETTADNASTEQQQPVGRVGKKPKPDAANGEQKPGHDPSTTPSGSQ
jgi:hypothetical protein